MKRLAFLFFLLCISTPALATSYYVSHAGSDSNTGTTVTASWRTLAYAEDQLVAGDTVYVKADSAYTDADGANGCVLYVEKVGTALLPITFEGYKATPGDGATFADGSGRFEIDATGKTYGIYDAASVATNRYRAFRNCYVHGASSNGIGLIFASYVWYTNVESSLNGGVGIYSRDACLLVNCTTSNNSGYGIVLNSNAQVFQSLIKDNAASGGNCLFTSAAEVKNCIFIKTSGTPAVAMLHFNNSFQNCVFYGSGSSNYGIKYYSTGSIRNDIVQNCIFVNVVKGIELYTGANNLTNYMSNNCFYGVTTPYTNCASSGGDVLADPLFVDAANGDFHLRAGSPCIGAGVNGSDIGAYGLTENRIFGVRIAE